MDCPRCLTPLNEVYTPEAVVVDFCSHCKGTWHDKGELLFLSKQPRRLRPLLEGPLSAPAPSGIRCPRCNATMEEGGLGSAEPRVDRCVSCGGVWLDAGERANLDRLGATRIASSVLAAAPAATATGRPSTPRGAPPLGPPPRLPSLALRSLAVVTSLYAMVFVAMLVAGHWLGVSFGTVVVVAICFVFLQYLMAPLVMDLLLRWLHSLRWASKDELPTELIHAIERICRAKKIPFPRVGIIDDGNPNAFTYGHHPWNARLVVTAGLLVILDERELEAVVAHEIGHVVHWDMLVMTLAALVPIILAYMYDFLDSLGRSRAAEARKGRVVPPYVLLVIYLLYRLAEYFVLYLSRAREYYADRFSGWVTGNANALAGALVKIAYGLAAAEPDEAAEKDRSRLKAMGVLGIFDSRSAPALAVAAGGSTGLSSADVVGAMQWDMWNPWAGFYELGSSHPLPAKRILALGDLARHQRQEPLVTFDVARPESYWDDFFFDLFVIALPFLIPLAALAFVVPLDVLVALLVGRDTSWLPDARTLGFVSFGLGAGALIRTILAYPGGIFPQVSVASLLKKVKVSAIRAHPVRLSGTIIGRGIPGLIYSEDLVLQDRTGFIFLDYRSPLRIIELYFGLARAGDIVGREVVVEGWYRRAPMPYVEMKSIAYPGARHGCYVYQAKVILSFVVAAVGLAVLFLA